MRKFARHFLEQNHEYRSDVKSFKKGPVVHDPKPIPKTGKEIKAELDALQPKPDGNGFLGYGETHQWTHKPCLWNTSRKTAIGRMPFCGAWAFGAPLN